MPPYDAGPAGIDSGRPFDWGRTSGDYAAFRDLYPARFWRIFRELGLAQSGQDVLDLGTGTGVLPRHLCHQGAHWTGLDASAAQIGQARRLSAHMPVEYIVAPAEAMPFADGSFDVVTAAQCFFYFDHDQLAPQLQRVLRSGGRLLVSYLTWLPGEDPLAAASEQLVLKYNPLWSGGGETFRDAEIPPQYGRGFRQVLRRKMRLALRFTRESWHGRMRACRATGASMAPEQLRAWEREHVRMLAREAPPEFAVQHCLALALLEKC